MYNSSEASSSDRDSPVVDLGLSDTEQWLVEPSLHSNPESTADIANDVLPLIVGVCAPNQRTSAPGPKGRKVSRSYFGRGHGKGGLSASVIAHEKAKARSGSTGSDIRIDVKSGKTMKQRTKHIRKEKVVRKVYEDHSESKPAEPKKKWFGKDRFFRLNNPRIVRRHVGYSYGRNWFHTILTMKWTWQLITVFAMYFLVNGFFALLYWSGGADQIRGFEEGSADYLWLSVQTLTTVGYGRLEPRSIYLQIVASIEATIGIVVLAITSGLAFSIIARPSSAVLFSNVIVVEPETVSTAGRRLHFRISNRRETSLLYDTQMQVMFGWMVIDHINGGTKWESKSLTLESGGYNANINVCQSYFHVITPDSPLYGIKNSKWLKNHRARMSAVLICHDNDWCTTTASHKVYQADDFKFNHLFVNVSTASDEFPGAYYLEYNNFHRTKDFGAIINTLFDLLDTDRNESLSREELQNFANNPPKEATKDLRFDADRLLTHFDELASARAARVKPPPTVPEEGPAPPPIETEGVAPFAIEVPLQVEVEEWDMVLSREDFIRGVMLMRKEQFDQRQIGQIET